MPTSRTSRSGNTARNDIITMLKDDHKKAKKAFKDFEKLDPTEDAEECQLLVEQTCAELTLHTTLEEELLYPAARGALPEADLVDEAEVEHGSAKQLIEQLKGMSPGDEKYAAMFKVLGEYVQHHVKEEESEMFPQLEKSKLDWESLCDEMNSRRAELTEELLPDEVMQAEDSEDEDAPTTAAASRGAAAKSKSGGAGKSRGGESRAQAAGTSKDEEE